MSILSIPRIFFFSVVIFAVIFIANVTFAAAPSAIDSALNNSLEESKNLNQQIDQSFSQKKVSEHKQKARPAVEINMDEAEADRAATYKDVQASGSLRNESF